MEIKDFDDYTKDEQTALLLHWWYYYGKIIFTLEEIENFKKMIEKDSRQILALATLGYYHGITNQPIIAAMRQNKMDELLATIPNFNDEKTKESFLTIEKDLIKELVKTYNNPEPSIPLDQTTLTNQILNILEKSNNKDKKTVKIKKKKN